VRRAFEWCREGRRGAPADGVKRVTCVDKASVLRSYAFFRQVFQETARDFPDVRTDYASVEGAVARSLVGPAARTADIGGAASTRQCADGVVQALA
jgi:3-isopropylmalate dehydrogenase